MMTPIEREKYMDKAEVKQLRDSTTAWAFKDNKAGRRQGVVSWMLVDLALMTGLRVGEIAALKVGDIDFKRGGLRVTRLKRKIKKPELMPISKTLLEHLREYVAWKDQAGESIKPGAILIAGKRGTMGTRGLQIIWKQAVERAGLDDFLSIHSARHTLAVNLLKKTSNLRQVQKQLGHANPTTTANMYADISFEDMQNGTEGLYDD